MPRSNYTEEVTFSVSHFFLMDRRPCSAEGAVGRLPGEGGGQAPARPDKKIKQKGMDRPPVGPSRPGCCCSRLSRLPIRSRTRRGRAGPPSPRRPARPGPAQGSSGPPRSSRASSQPRRRPSRAAVRAQVGPGRRARRPGRPRRRHWAGGGGRGGGGRARGGRSREGEAPRQERAGAERGRRKRWKLHGGVGRA